MSVKISIVLAAYNGEKYIYEQIESILNQTYTNFELVVIDDCSTDATVSIIESFGFDRLRLFRNSFNMGCFDSFLKAISLASGRYVCLCDQDDIWKVNKLERLIDNIEDNVAIYSGNELIDGFGVAIKNSKKYVNNLSSIDSHCEIFSNIAIFNSFVLGCSLMFCRESFSLVPKLNVTNFNHDRWIVMTLSQIGSIKFLDEKLFKYRIHDRNHSLSPSVKNKSISYKIKMLAKGKIDQPPTYDKEILEALCSQEIFANTPLSNYLQSVRKNELVAIIKNFRFMYRRVSRLGRLRLISKYILFKIFSRYREVN